MPKVFVTTREGKELTLEPAAGTTLMEIIRDNASDELLALCGGCCSCATCHVYVDPAFQANLPKMTYDENDLLDGTSHRKPTSRLACQVPVTDAIDGIRVTIAPED